MRPALLMCVCFSLTGCLTPRSGDTAAPWRISSAAPATATLPRRALIHDHPQVSPVYRVFPLTVGLENRGAEPLQAVSVSLRLPTSLHVVNPPPGTVEVENQLTLPVFPALGSGKRATMRLLVRPGWTGRFDYAIVLTADEVVAGGRRPVDIGGGGTVTITRPVLRLTSRSIRAGDDTVRCVVSIKNIGDAPAFGTLLLWDIPSGSRLVPPFPGTVTGGQWLVNVGTISPGEEMDVTGNIFVDAGRPDAGTVEVSATGAVPVRRVIDHPPPPTD
ncbi:MAG: hypothetical protein RRC34_03075 [Lentisphaeria bacterium]|nr:hypothetical protein [Lentisphaeria bacterium]